MASIQFGPKYIFELKFVPRKASGCMQRDRKKTWIFVCSFIHMGFISRALLLHPRPVAPSIHLSSATLVPCSRLITLYPPHLTPYFFLAQAVPRPNQAAEHTAGPLAVPPSGSLWKHPGPSPGDCSSPGGKGILLLT